MEDAATAEISRAQVWQWTHHATAALADGRKLTPELYKQVLGEEVARIGVLRIPVRERCEHHHGVTAVGRDEMETVESEVRGYQSDGQTSNAGGGAVPGVMHPVRDGFGRQRKRHVLL